MNIFDFTTYDSGIDEFMVAKAIEVCEAITDGKTFQYIEDADNYRWYIVMCNMPFFADKLNWGGSIRGAWWDHKDYEFSSCGGLWVNEKQVLDWKFTREEWLEFIRAVIAFYRG